MWTPEHRAAARRQDLRYASDLTDEEWALVAPMIPPARRGGRPRDVNMREVINGLLYLLWTGCQWQALPKDLPPKSTVHYYFKLWDWDGTLERIHYALYVAVREQAGREASPSAAIIDSQSAKTAQKGGPRTVIAHGPPGHRRRSPASGSHRTWHADLPHHALRQLVHSTCKRLQLPIRETHFGLQQRCPFFDLVENV